MVSWLSKNQTAVIVTIITIGVIYFLYSISFTIQEQNEQLNAQTSLTSIRETYAVEEQLNVGYILTREYIQSDEYIIQYERNELGKQLEGERRVVLSEVIVSAESIATPVPTPNYPEDVKSWQIWWQLLSDTPITVEQ